MKLSELLGEITVLDKINFANVNIDIDIKMLSQNSKEKQDKSLFFAIDGKHFATESYVNDLNCSGCEIIVAHRSLESSLPQIIVADVRVAMSKMAVAFYKNNNDDVKLVYVVGTNGKTSTCEMLSSVLNISSVPCGVIGTLGASFNNLKWETNMTTPDVIMLNKIIREMTNLGAKVIALELSAHGIYYNKVCGLRAEIIIFTNCTRDHLDFFDTFEAYKECKKSAFEPSFARLAIVNVDDICGREIDAISIMPKITYGIYNPSDVFAIDIKLDANCTEFTVNYLDEIMNIKTCLLGEFNIYNLLGVISAIKWLTIPTDAVVKGIAEIKPVNGRFQRVLNQLKVNIVIDYAHTPDGLYNILSAARGITDNKLVVLFGCGGDRDEGKRQIMGEIAAKCADLTILTSDNPRSEDPLKIIVQIAEGVKRYRGKFISILGRENAINFGINYLNEGDTLIIAGKGAEEYMEIGNQRYKFSDYATVKSVLEGLY